jgi:hypothetical protein
MNEKGGWKERLKGKGTREKMEGRGWKRRGEKTKGGNKSKEV